MMKRKVVAGTLVALVLSVGGGAVAAVVAGDEPPKVDRSDICDHADKDKAVAEMCSTGFMPVVGQSGERRGVVAWSDLTDPNGRKPGQGIPIYRSDASGERGEQIDTLPVAPATSGEQR